MPLLSNRTNYCFHSYNAVPTKKRALLKKSYFQSSTVVNVRKEFRLQTKRYITNHLE